MYPGFSNRFQDKIYIAIRIVIIQTLNFFIFMYIPCISYSSLSRPTNVQHIYIYIYALYKISLIYMYVCMYVGFKTFCIVRHLDSIASYLRTGLHLGFFRSRTPLYFPSSFSSVFLVLSCFGIHFNAILGNLPSAILSTWLYHC